MRGQHGAFCSRHRVKKTGTVGRFRAQEKLPSLERRAYRRACFDFSTFGYSILFPSVSETLGLNSDQHETAGKVGGVELNGHGFLLLVVLAW